MPEALGTIEVRRMKFEIRATLSDVGGGRFFTEHQGATVYGASMDELRGKLMAATATSNLKLAVKFVQLSNGRLRAGTVVGVHGGNDNLIVRWDGEEKNEQFSRYGRGAEKYLMPIDDEVRDQILALQVTRDKAVKAYNDRLSLFEINLNAAIKQAIEAAGGSSD